MERVTHRAAPELDVVARATAVAAVMAGGALIWAAMTVYPGGTAWNAAAPGHDFWLNFLCDLQRATARSGAPNPVASHLTQGAMATLASAFVAHFWLAARLAGLDRRPYRQVLCLGAASAVGTFVVAFMPTDTFGTLHDIGIAVGTIPGLVAVGILIPPLARHTHGRLPAVVGAAFLAIASVDFVLYVHQLATATPSSPVVAILERLSFLLLLTWMLVIALTQDPQVDHPENGEWRLRAATLRGDPRRAAAAIYCTSRPVTERQIRPLEKGARRTDDVDSASSGCILNGINKRG